MAISKELLSEVKTQKHRSSTNSYVMSDIDDLLVKNIDMTVYVACETVKRSDCTCLGRPSYIMAGCNCWCV